MWYRTTVALLALTAVVAAYGTDRSPRQSDGGEIGVAPTSPAGSEPPLPPRAAAADIARAFAAAYRMPDTLRPLARPAPLPFDDMPRRSTLIAEVHIAATGVHLADVPGWNQCRHRAVCTMVNARVLRWWKPPERRYAPHPTWLQIDLPGAQGVTVDGFYPRRGERYVVFLEGWGGGPALANTMSKVSLAAYPFLGADGWWAVGPSGLMATRAGGPHAWSTWDWQGTPIPLRDLWLWVQSVNRE